MTEEIPPVAAALLDWFRANMRPLPWRERYTPYEVWIAEVMLQQTRRERGAEYFTRWMRLFPTLGHLAEAPLEDLIKAFEGLGYYSRVRNLQRAARIVLREHAGELPADPALLRRLPGIGEYTAGAIASIAFNQPHVAVDANVERVLARLLDLRRPAREPETAALIRQAARELMPIGSPRRFNQALMELGALVCAKKPRCQDCPLAAHCLARRRGTASDLPMPGKKTVYTALERAVGILAHQGRIFLQKRPDSGLWAGFWEFPGTALKARGNTETQLAAALLRETGLRVRVIRPLGRARHSYTRYRLTLHGFLVAPATPEPRLPLPEPRATAAHCWVLPGAIASLSLAGGDRKLWEACRSLL